NGRGGSFTNKNPKVGGFARADYTGIKGLLAGVSIYADNRIKMFDIHADYKIGAFEAYGVYTQTTRSNGGQLVAGESTKAKGGYLNLSYDILSFTGSKYRVPIFIQYDSVDAQSSLVAPTTAQYDPVNTTTVGINFYPHEQVVFKADYAMPDNSFGNDLSTNTKNGEDIFSISLGFIF
ncbi:MAG TPA: porin, partial [Sulfurimonas autotrophica]|nr:porin [Sulfurimonas autotrophica]